MPRKHPMSDPEAENSRNQTTYVPFHLQGIGEEYLHVEQRLSPDNGPRQCQIGSAVGVFEKTYQESDETISR